MQSQPTSKALSPDQALDTLKGEFHVPQFSQEIILDLMRQALPSHKLAIMQFMDDEYQQMLLTETELYTKSVIMILHVLRIKLKNQENTPLTKLYCQIYI